MLPLLFGTRARAYLKIYNVLNMFNDDWGVQNDAQFFSQEVMAVSIAPLHRSPGPLRVRELQSPQHHRSA